MNASVAHRANVCELLDYLANVQLHNSVAWTLKLTANPSRTGKPLKAEAPTFWFQKG
jgi:hypothetical protein